jgi:hypothetical protein
MFALAIYIGIYSYLIFFLGVFGLLFKPFVLVVTIIFFLCLAIIYRLRFKSLLSRLDVQKIVKKLKSNKLFTIISLIILLQALINLIGVFGPEISFDALWYHLTLPKLYSITHAIFYIPGSNLFY